MKAWASGRVWCAVLGTLVLVSGASAEAPPLPPSAAGQGPVVGSAVKHDVSPELRHTPPIPRGAGPQIVIIRRPRLPKREGPRLAIGRDPVLQDFSGPLSMPSATQTFDGVANVNGVLPPDPNGAVGPGHYVQWVNLSFAVYDKSGRLLYGPAAGNTLWQGFGGACETENGGDPIVLYDKQANRWLMSQLAYPNFPNGPFYQCIAVSQTGDPLGAFHRYAFVISDALLNDYPKFGIWPDGYYLAVNQFACVDIIPPFGFYTCDWAGQGAFVFERDRMLAGQGARMVGFSLPTSNLGGMLPSDLDGPTPPPTGAPNYFVQVDDNAWFTPTLPQDRLQIWPFHVDWTDPSQSTFGPGPPGSDTGIVLDTAPFDSNLCGYSSNCIPQPGFDVLGLPSPGLDALADRLMHRLAYRNFGTHQTLVLNHTVDVDGTDHAGIRWYELRDAGTGWSIHQQGTYAPDGRHRWMGSIAMDGAGNIALGFSLSSRVPETYPSIGYVGRDAADPLGMLAQAETLLWAGNGAQEDSSGRWGDYTALTVDPTDDCTFWYTNEYYPSTDVITGVNWRTRIGSFRFASCGASPDAPPSVSVTSPAGGATVSGTVTVTANASDDHGVSQVEFLVDGVSIGVDTTGGNGWSMPWNTTGATNGNHTLTARATDTTGQTATSDPVPVTVANPTGSPTSMGVYSINWQSGRNLTVTVRVRRDSDASGVLTTGDAVVTGAAVTLLLTRDSDNSTTFDTCQPAGPDRCWTFTGNTNKNGDFSAKLIGAPGGRYQAKVTSLTHGTYTWTPSLDVDNPDTFTK
jgi:hypothetical protein